MSDILDDITDFSVARALLFNALRRATELATSDKTSDERIAHHVASAVMLGGPIYLEAIAEQIKRANARRDNKCIVCFVNPADHPQNEYCDSCRDKDKALQLRALSERLAIADLHEMPTLSHHKV